jgi:hypothetical protein
MDALVSRRSSTVGALLGVAAAAALVLIATLFGREEPKQVGQPGSVSFSRPLAAGTKVSMTEAMQVLDLVVFRPSASLANDESISEVWVRAQQFPEQAFIIYDSGITVDVLPASEVAPTLEAAEIQLADGSAGHLGTVRGIDAFIVPPDAKNGTLGSVRFAIHGASIGVVGNGTIPIESLIQVAESVVDNAATVRAQEASVA